ncbi:MAG TPA: LptF/LptG family permease [Tepidisphaeraceae bacterium]
MRIITRYILTAYIKNYLISLFVLIGLYIVLDMVFNFDEFAVSRDTGSASATVWNIAGYYFFQSFRIFAQLSGVIPVAAAAFTFLRLSRFNELTAMMAAGMHLVRVATPAIIFAVIVSIVLPLLNQELVIPNIIPQLTRARSDQADARQARAIQSMQDDKGSLLYGARYDPPTSATPAAISELDVLLFNPRGDGGTAAPDAYGLGGHITASFAKFNPATGGWDLEDGRLTTGIAPGSGTRRTVAVAEYKSNITPEEIALFRSSDFVELLATPRINELLQRTQIYGGNDLLRVKHARFAQLLLNIIMVLLAISSVLIREPGQTKYAVMRCLILVGLCMAMIFICGSIADRPLLTGPFWADRWAALSAWAPILVFGPLSVFLIDRVKT